MGLRVEYGTPCKVEGCDKTIGFEGGKFLCQDGHEAENAEGVITKSIVENAPKAPETGQIEGDAAEVSRPQFENDDLSVSLPAESEDRDRFEQVKAQRDAVNAQVPPTADGCQPMIPGRTLTPEELASKFESGELVPMIPIGGEMTLPGGDVLVCVRLPELYVGAIRELALSSNRSLSNWLSEEFLAPRIEQEFSLPNQPV